MQSSNSVTVLCSYHMHMSDFLHVWVLILFKHYMCEMTSVGGRVLVTAGDPVKQGLLQAVEEKLLSFPSSVLT